MARRIFVALCILVLASRSAWAQSATRDILRQRTSPDGVPDAALAAQTGWSTVRGYAYKVLLKAPDGSYKPVDPRQPFRTGQSFRLEIEAHNDLWFYILNRGPDGAERLLLPEGDEEHLLIRRGERVTVPSDGCFTFADPPGTERFRIVASPDKLPWANPHELFQLENGRLLAPSQELAARGQQETRARSIETLERRQARLEIRDEPLAKVIERSAGDAASRSKNTILRPPPPEGGDTAATDIVRASPDARDRSPFIHKIQLEHKRP
ncbi:MAG: DUF4384 domain-containing protein [Isosphaeraceae bacterium]